MRLASEFVTCAASGPTHALAASAGSQLGAASRAAFSLAPQWQQQLLAPPQAQTTAELGGEKAADAQARPLSHSLSVTGSGSLASVAGASVGAGAGDAIALQGAGLGSAPPVFSPDPEHARGYVAGAISGLSPPLGSSPVRGYDCCLVVDGREILAHRALLAARSPLLSKRLEAETRPGRRTSTLFLADLSFATAARLVEFLYTDDLATLSRGLGLVGDDAGLGRGSGGAGSAADAVGPLGALSPELRALADAAAAYGVPRLEALCRVMLEAPATFWMRQMRAAETAAAQAKEAREAAAGNGRSDGDRDRGSATAATDAAAGGEATAASVAPDLLLSPPAARERQRRAAVALADAGGASLLAAQLLESAFLSPRWADLYLVAEGWRFPVHAAVLCASAEYFRVLLRGAMGGEDGAGVSGGALGRAAAGGGSLFGFGGGGGLGVGAGSDGGTGPGSGSVAGSLSGRGSLMRGAGSAEEREPVEIEVPDSAMTLVRMLFFCYSGWLAPLPRGAAEAAVEGLVPGVPIFCARAAGDAQTPPGTAPTTPPRPASPASVPGAGAGA